MDAASTLPPLTGGLAGSARSCAFGASSRVSLAGWPGARAAAFARGAPLPSDPAPARFVGADAAAGLARAGAASRLAASGTAAAGARLGSATCGDSSVTVWGWGGGEGWGVGADI